MNHIKEKVSYYKFVPLLAGSAVELGILKPDAKPHLVQVSTNIVFFC